MNVLLELTGCGLCANLKHTLIQTDDASQGSLWNDLSFHQDPPIPRIIEITIQDNSHLKLDQEDEGDEPTEACTSEEYSLHGEKYLETDKGANAKDLIELMWGYRMSPCYIRAEEDLMIRDKEDSIIGYSSGTNSSSSAAAMSSFIKQRFDDGSSYSTLEDEFSFLSGQKKEAEEPQSMKSLPAVTIHYGVDAADDVSPASSLSDRLESTPKRRNSSRTSRTMASF